MKAEKPKLADEMRMSIEDFDKIMSQALRVKPGPKKARQLPKRRVSTKQKKGAK